MPSKENTSLLAKLALQTQSFQDGFESLVKSKDFSQMAKIFSHLIRGSFFLNDIHLFHKLSEKSNWQNVGLNENLKNFKFNYFDEFDKQSIKFLENDKFSCAIILPLSDSSILGILLGNKLNKKALSLFEKITLQMFLQIFDIAYTARLDQRKIKKLVFELNEKVLQLNKLLDTGIELSKLESKKNKYNFALERLCSITNSASSIFTIVPKNSSNEKSHIISFPPGLDLESVQKNKFIIKNSFEFNEKLYTVILSEKEIRGGTTNFTELDSFILEAISGQILTSIKNEFFLQQSLEKERIEKELNMASSIQKQIIPQKLPQIEGLSISGINIPSREVGGDYFDFIDLGNGKYALVIADVTGKGMAAALLVNTLNAALYSHLTFSLTVGEICERLNKLIFNSTPQDTFITFIIGILDTKTYAIDIVNAGHNSALLYRNNGSIEEIKSSALALGMFDLEAKFRKQRIKLEPNESLFFYTDGIPEAMDNSSNLYSDERLSDFFSKNQNKSPQDFTDTLINDVKSFANGTLQSDDITMLIIKRL